MIFFPGKEELCKLLVQNGAKTDATNSVKRTPSAMAAFVGNHNCVAVINNFVPKVRQFLDSWLELQQYLKAN